MGFGSAHEHLHLVRGGRLRSDSQQVQVGVAHFTSEPCVLRGSIVAGHDHTPRGLLLFGSYSREQAVCPTPIVNFDALTCLLLMARYPAARLQLNHESRISASTNYA